LRQFFEKSFGSVDLAEGLQDGPRMNGDMTCLNIGIDKVAYQSIAVAIEVDTNQFASTVEYRRAGVASNSICGGHEIQRCVRVEVLAMLEPTGR
jgi:hypothetical protein